MRRHISNTRPWLVRSRSLEHRFGIGTAEQERGRQRMQSSKSNLAGLLGSGIQLLEILQSSGRCKLVGVVEEFTFRFAKSPGLQNLGDEARRIAPPASQRGEPCHRSPPS